MSKYRLLWVGNLTPKCFPGDVYLERRHSNSCTGCRTAEVIRKVMKNN